MRLSDALSEIKLVFERALSALFVLRFWNLVLLVLGANIITQGIWMVPNLDKIYLMSVDITQNPYPGSVMQLFLSSFLMPIIAYIIGLNKSPAAYFTACTLVLLIGGALAIAQLRRRFGEETTRILILVLGATPLLNVLLTWVGYSDPLVVIISTFLIACPRPAGRAVLSALLAIAHFEQGAIIVILISALIPFIDADRKNYWPAIGAMVSGLIIGKLAIEIFFYVNNFQIQTTRETVMNYIGYRRLISDALRFPLTLLFSVLNVTWFILVLILYAAYKAKHHFFLVMILGMLICFGVATFVLDQSRVAAILTWPLLLGAIIIAARDTINLPLLKKVAAGCFFLGLIVPRIIVWEGQIHTSAASFTLMMVSDTIAGTHLLDQSRPDWRIAPFRQLAPGP